MYPGKIAENILFAFPITNARGLLPGIIGHLKEICTRGTDETKLVFRRGIEDQRGKRPTASGLVMQVLSGWGFQTMVCTIAIDAEVISGAVIMIAKAQLIVCGVLASIAGYKFALP